MAVRIDPGRVLNRVDPMIYGQFIEHFHRQIYGGIYDPASPFADEDGFRTDVIAALKRIRIPILRWSGGCFVSAYHWRDGVGGTRTPVFNKAWRVPEPNTFGTHEYIRLCRKLGCEPYICTNAGTGTPEEMSDWVEYCNLPPVTRCATARRDNGSPEPFGVKYWSIGNENYGPWEIGAKDAKEWARLVLESAKMIRRTDPSVELSAAALNDMDWNAELLKACGKRLNWISIHGYWDFHSGRNETEDYETCVSYIRGLEKPVRQVKGLLTALDCGHIRIAYDEWNLRAWYHPNIMDLYQGRTEAEYLKPRDGNDRNELYTMADAVFSACFLNMCIRNGDAVGMAAFSPCVNTRGMIFTHAEGVVLRSTYLVFDLYVNELGRERIDLWQNGGADPDTDLAATVLPERGLTAVAAVNPAPETVKEVTFDLRGTDLRMYRVLTVNGASKDSYNDIGLNGVVRRDTEWAPAGETLKISLEPHSVNVIQLRR